MSYYEVRWDAKAQYFLRTLESGIAKRIFRKVDVIRGNPLRFLERLVGVKSYKLRIGDYRAIIDVDESRKLLEVRFVGHRKNVYRELSK